MRIKLLNGAVVEVGMAKPFKEVLIPKITDNDEDLIFRKETKNIAKASGVSFEASGSDALYDFNIHVPQYYIGNLTNEQVLKLLDAMHSNGCFDLADLEYQQVKDEKGLRLGLGYLPYCSEITELTFYNMLKQGIRFGNNDAFGE